MKWSIIIWISLLNLLLAVDSKGDDGADILERFKMNDMKVTLMSPLFYTAAFTATTSGSISPTEDLANKTCRVWWSNSFCMITESNSYSHAPVYSQNGLPNDYNDYNRKGDLIQWRPLETYILFSKEQNDMWLSSVCYVISSNGTIHSATSQKTVYNDRIGSHNSIYLYDQFCLATGRGFAQHLDKVISITTVKLGDSLKRLDALGSYGRLQGSWNILFDERSDYIVREASFTADGKEKPALITVNSGTVECPGLNIAASGSVTYGGDYRVQFEVLNIEKISVDNFDFELHRKSIAHVFDSPPSGDKIETWDLRGSTPSRTYH